MPRWALETQVAFAVDKARELRRAQEANVAAIVERTLTEDIDIYAAFFRDRGYINDHSARLYDAVVAELSRNLAPPDVVIVCHAAIQTIQQRVANRNRDKDRLYPEGHVEEISERYKQLNVAALGRLVYAVDGERYDWRSDEVLSQITRELREILFATHSGRLQMTMPWLAKDTSEPILSPVSDHALDVPAYRVSREREKRTVYIAAPFTSEEATPEDRSNIARLFAHRGRARIGRGAYRAALLGVAAAFRQYGLEALLPHRDVSRWGDAKLSERDIAVRCTKAVLDCDLFLGLLGRSPGAHYECGLAIAAGKPAILITSDDLNDSTIAQGISGVAVLRGLHAGPLLSLRAAGLAEVPGLLNGPEVSDFIARWLPGLVRVSSHLVSVLLLRR